MNIVQAAASEPRHVLEEIEETLQALGASKSNLLTARILLSDNDLFPDYDHARVWRLAEPRPAERGIDITVTATK